MIGCWPFMPEDVVPELADRKVERLPGGHAVMRNCWVGGTGFVMKRQCVRRNGPLRRGQSFPNYCIHLAADGWKNGWYWPPLVMPNMDDPRSPLTMMRTEADFQACRSLSAQRCGVTSLEAFRRRQPLLARHVQEAVLDPFAHLSRGGRLRHLFRRMRRA